METGGRGAKEERVEERTREGKVKDKGRSEKGKRRGEEKSDQ